MSFYTQQRSLGAVDPSQPWWVNLLNTAENIADTATQKPVQSVNALTAEVANTRQTVLYLTIGIGALLLLTRKR